MTLFEIADALLRYEPESGLLYWKVNRGGSHPRRIGDVAGTPRPSGHIMASVGGRKMMVHVVAWLLMTGDLPPDELDHRDVDPSNNKWSNLRVGRRAGNAKNKKLRVDNTSGFKGVSRWKDKWKAEIMSDGKSRYLGLYDTREGAHAAYCDAAKRFHGDFARVR